MRKLEQEKTHGFRVARHAPAVASPPTTARGPVPPEGTSDRSGPDRRASSRGSRPQLVLVTNRGVRIAPDPNPRRHPVLQRVLEACERLLELHPRIRGWWLPPLLIALAPLLAAPAPAGATSSYPATAPLSAPAIPTVPGSHGRTLPGSAARALHA